MSNHSLTKNSKIRIVELLAYQFGKLNGELCFDEYSSALSPSRATHTLEAILKYDGQTNIRSLNPLIHGEKGMLSSRNLEDIFSSDFLLISYITRTAKQSLEFARLAKKV